MKERSRKIEAAIRYAKKRDEHTCQRCGSGVLNGVSVDGAHLLPRNSPQPRYRASNPDHIVTLCRLCHQSYDSNKTHATRRQWLLDAGLRVYAERLDRIYGGEP